MVLTTKYRTKDQTCKSLVLVYCGVVSTPYPIISADQPSNTNSDVIISHQVGRESIGTLLTRPEWTRLLIGVEIFRCEYQNNLFWELYNTISWTILMNLFRVVIFPTCEKCCCCCCCCCFVFVLFFLSSLFWTILHICQTLQDGLWNKSLPPCAMVADLLNHVISMTAKLMIMYKDEI